MAQANHARYGVPSSRGAARLALRPTWPAAAAVAAVALVVAVLAVARATRVGRAGANGAADISPAGASSARNAGVSAAAAVGSWAPGSLLIMSEIPPEIAAGCAATPPLPCRAI